MMLTKYGWSKFISDIHKLLNEVIISYVLISMEDLIDFYYLVIIYNAILYILHYYVILLLSSPLPSPRYLCVAAWCESVI